MKSFRFFASIFLGAVFVGKTFSQDASTLAKAVPRVEIKGHSIGETLLQFAVAEGTPQMFQDCAALVLDPSTEKRYATEPKYSYKAGAESYTQSDSDWWAFKSRVDKCVNLADGLKGKTIVLSSRSAGKMTFADKKLIRISMAFAETQPDSTPTGAPGSLSSAISGLNSAIVDLLGLVGPPLSFDDVLHDLTAKFGPPDTMGTRQMQNGFGGIFTFPVATWTSRPDVTIYATQDRDNTYTHLTTVVIQDRAFVDRMVQLQNARPNALK